MARHVSRFVPDAARMPEFLACLWQGDVPESLALERWLYLQDERGGRPRGMLVMWAGDDVATAYMERAFGGFGEFTTEVVVDNTPGLAAALARDLDAFGTTMARQGAAPDAIASALDLRRRGMEAPSQQDAAAAGRAWQAEQQEQG
ncbi:MAG TPA: hypothetical protein VH986_12185 [Acidimicrobiia bacterium]